MLRHILWDLLIKSSYEECGDVGQEEQHKADEESQYRRIKPDTVGRKYKLLLVCTVFYT